jgi:hypothetical protein
LKIEIFELEFDSEYYYIERDTIVERVVFDNRTLYSEFEKVNSVPTPLLVHQHLAGELTIALPLIKNSSIDYIVLEYNKEQTNHFFYLIKHLLKSLQIELFYTYESSTPNSVQIFIPVSNLTLESVYFQVEKIEELIEVNSPKKCKILPNRNLPIIYNKITLPIKKM